MPKITVKAIRPGYYGDTLRIPGDPEFGQFQIEEKHFSKAWMKRVEAAQEEAKQEDGEGKGAGEPAGNPLEKLNVPELKAMAEELEIPGASNMKKAELITVITAAQEEAKQE